MDFWTHVKEAVINLFTSKLRSFLAILGVLVGTGSVVALISSSQLATSHALAQFKELGTNLLAMSVQDGQGQSGGAQKSEIMLSNMRAIIASSDQIVRAAPYITLFKNMYFDGNSLSGEILGADQSLADIAKIAVKRGRFVSLLDKQSFYCVIGSKLAKKIRSYGKEPMYNQIQLGDHLFTIIGVVKPWKPNLFIFADINNGVIIPLRTSYLLSKDAAINNILFRLVQKPNIQQTQADLTAKMQSLFPNKQVSFRNPEQIISIVGKQRATFTWLLGAIGGISLLVGGIGVMNIMLVSVVERRREIGIRMAIGAMRSDILKMFLIESVILTTFGGLLGIITGIGVSYILALVTKWQFELYVLPPLLGFVVSVLVGMLSGFYPALRASRLDPIKTLQSQ